MNNNYTKIGKDFIERMNLQSGKDVSNRCYIMNGENGKILTLLAPENITELEKQELKNTGFELIQNDFRQ